MASCTHAQPEGTPPPHLPTLLGVLNGSCKGVERRSQSAHTTPTSNAPISCLLMPPRVALQAAPLQSQPLSFEPRRHPAAAAPAAPADRYAQTATATCNGEHAGRAGRTMSLKTEPAVCSKTATKQVSLYDFAVEHSTHSFTKQCAGQDSDQHSVELYCHATRRSLPPPCSRSHLKLYRNWRWSKRLSSGE